MIQFSEIQPGDLIKVVVVVDDVEDELYARVSDNRGDHLELHYFEECSLTYKGARVYLLEPDLNIIRCESICEHFPGGETIFENITENRYVLKTEIDSSEESTFYDDSESDAMSFVVSDEDGELPPDHVEVDRRWTEWVPLSEGSRKFKSVVDDIETRVKSRADDAQF